MLDGKMSKTSVINVEYIVFWDAKKNKGIQMPVVTVKVLKISKLIHFPVQ